LPEVEKVVVVGWLLFVERVLLNINGGVACGFGRLWKRSRFGGCWGSTWFGLVVLLLSLSLSLLSLSVSLSLVFFILSGLRVEEEAGRFGFCELKFVEVGVVDRRFDLSCGSFGGGALNNGVGTTCCVVFVKEDWILVSSEEFVIRSIEVSVRHFVLLCCCVFLNVVERDMLSDVEGGQDDRRHSRGFIVFDCHSRTKGKRMSEHM